MSSRRFGFAWHYLPDPVLNHSYREPYLRPCVPCLIRMMMVPGYLCNIHWSGRACLPCDILDITSECCRIRGTPRDMRDLRDLHLASRRIARRHRVRIATYFRLCNRSLRILMDLLSPHELRQQIASGLEQLREREWLDQEQPGEFEPIVVDLSYVELPDFDDDLESDVLIWS